MSENVTCFAAHLQLHGVRLPQADGAGPLAALAGGAPRVPALHVSTVQVHNGLRLGVHLARVLPGGHHEGVQSHGALRPAGVHVVQALLQLLVRRRILQP